MLAQIGDLLKSLHWINEKYIQPETVGALREKFHRGQEKFLILDDFVDADALRNIRKLLVEDGECKEVYRRYKDKNFVESEEFYNSNEDQRFIHEIIYQKPVSGKEMSSSTLDDVKMRAQFQSDAFHSWLRNVTGRDVQYTNAVNLKRLDRGHFLRWHNDLAERRVLCMVLYLHEGWRPGFGGRLQYKDENKVVRNIDPLFNRVVFFDSNNNFNHAVEPITEAAGDWMRFNYSVWFQGDRKKNIDI